MGGLGAKVRWWGEAPGRPGRSAPLLWVCLLLAAAGDSAFADGPPQPGPGARAGGVVVEDSLEAAMGERDRGAALVREGNLRGARDRFARAIALLERLAPQSLELAQVLRDRASVLTDLGQLDLAREDLGRSLATLERLRADRDMAPVLSNLGTLARKRGDFELAEKYYQRALDIWEREDPGGADVAGVLNDLGKLARTRGDADQAERHLERARVLFERRSPGNPGLADTLTVLGMLALDRGNLELSESYFKTALARFEAQQPGSKGHSSVLRALGFLATDRGDLELAERYQRSAVEILEKIAPESPDTATNLVDLAGVEGRRWHLEMAARDGRRAVSILEKTAPDSPQLGAALQLLGDIDFNRGDLAGARRHYERGLALIEARDPQSWAAASMLASVGEVMDHSGDRRAAKGYLERALRIAERMAPEGLETADMLAHLGKLERADRPELAVQYLRRAVEAVEHQLQHLGGSSSLKISFLAEREGYYRDLIEVLLGARLPRDAFAVLERSRGRGLLAMLAERDLSFPLDIPEALRAERRRMALEYDRTQQQIANLDPKRDRAQFDELSRQIRDLRRQQDEVEEKVRQASPRLASLQVPQPLDLAGAQRTLDPGTVMLAYSVGKDRTDLFIVAPGMPLEVKAIPSGREELERSIERLRALIPEARADSGLGRARQESFVALARRLFRLLIAPASGPIGTARRVLIVPDGPLHLLPWSALVRDTPRAGGRGWQYLAEWKPVHLALSATVYAELRRSRHAPTESRAATLMAFGDPLVPRGATGKQPAEVADLRLRSAIERGFSFAPLPFSRAEVERIAQLNPQGTRVYLGEAATEERAKAIGNETRYVHFATHSTLDEQSPLDSAVVLTIPEQVKGEQENGLLQAWEIFESVRLDADLVVLSGCESGLGKELRGEGLLSLTRAFQYAGARSVVASLWNVADQTTAELMVRFYRHLFAGQSKDEALRQAQVELLRPSLRGNGASVKAAGGGARAPFYWAAFQIYGDWQ
jgi:CHAT domain-containing protein